MGLLIFEVVLCETESIRIFVEILARACGVPVGRRSGGLGTTLVVTKNDIIFSFFFFLFPLSTFLIEGVLVSKNLLRES